VLAALAGMISLRSFIFLVLKVEASDKASGVNIPAMRTKREGHARACKSLGLYNFYFFPQFEIIYVGMNGQFERLYSFLNLAVLARDA
jgi:hypothetical protein